MSCSRDVSRLIENPARIDDPRRLQAWIVTTAKREALLQRRRGGRTVSMTRDDGDEDDGAQWDIADDSPLPDEVLSDIQELAVLRDALDRLDLRSAPPDVVRAAIGLWPVSRQASVASTAGALARRLVAALSFDSWGAAPALAGVRSGSSQTRHLLFTALDRDVDLRIVPAAGAFVLAGQVLGPDPAGRVELSADADEASTTPPWIGTIDEVGEFRLENVGQGAYRLTLHVGDDEIVLPSIDVGERHG